MKYTENIIPLNAFLKVSVSQRIRKVYFKDVKMYTKIYRKLAPSIPSFEDRKIDSYALDITD